MKKRLISALLTLVMCVSLLAIPAAADGISCAKTTTALNLRSGAATNKTIIMTMPKGAEGIIGMSQNGWCKIVYNNTVGYASAQYLTSVSSVSGNFGTATISGMAAFFSALFGTPLAAACFAMMVEDVGLTFTSAFVPAFTSALIAYGCSLAFGIAPTHFALTAPELNVRTALLVILLGVACAAVSRLFCYTLHFMEHTVPKLLPNPWVRVFAGGVLVIGFSYLFGVGRYNGAGMSVIIAAVEQGQALPWDFLCKIFLTALTLACGFKGGEVVPSFFVGATFGCVVGPLLGLPAEFAAAVGLVSIFCGATNVLIPSILLGFELFSGAGLELIALGCGICYMLSGHHGLYSSQTFVTNKLRSEYMSHKWRVRVKKEEE